MFYLLGVVLLVAMKCFYHWAGCSELQWLLYPTVHWVKALSGIAFEYYPQSGYVNHEFRFIIAPSCSGFQFMIVAIAMLIFSYVHRMKTKGKSLLWVMLSIGFSYLFTIFINGFRIVLSIYLPQYLYQNPSIQQVLPLFWYYAIVLGIPLIRGAYRQNVQSFVEYALLMTGVCMAVLVILFVLGGIRKYSRLSR